MRKTVCPICLRSDFQRTDDVVEKLFSFYDELCEFDILVNDNLVFCTTCEHLLRKFYNFRLRCRRAHKILKMYQSKGIENLQNLLPASPLRFATPSDNQLIIVIRYCDDQLENDKPSQMYTGNPISPNVQLSTEHNYCKEDLKIPADIKLKSIVTNTQNNVVNQNVISRNEEISNNDEISDNYEISDYDVSIEEEMNDEQNEEKEMNDEHLDSDEEFLRLISGKKKKRKTDEKKKKIEDFEEIDDMAPTKRRTDEKKKKIEDFEIEDFEEIDDMAPTKRRTDEKKKKIENFEEINDMAPTKRRTDEKKKKIEDFEIKDFEEIDDMAPTEEEIQVETQIARLKDTMINTLNQGPLDLGDDIILSKETFLQLLHNSVNISPLKQALLKQAKIWLMKDDFDDMAKVRKFLRYLMRRFNPAYEKVFRIEYLTTHTQRIAEFEARSKSEEYLKAEFKCDICYRIFETAGLLDYHKKWHDESREHACEICSMRFKTHGQIVSHSQNWHCAVFKCRHCHVTTCSFGAMRNHFDGHNGKTYKCDVCLKEYNSRSCFNTHRRSHTTHPCPYCTRNLVSTLGLHQHIKLKHPEAAGDSPQLSCFSCNAAFTSNKLLYQHLRSKHECSQTYRHKCHDESCEASFSSLLELKEHIAGAGHADPRPRRAPRPRLPGAPPKPRPPHRKCGLCGELIENTDRMSMPTHYKEAHPDVPFVNENCRHLCEHCGKAFKFLNYDHMNIHTGAKPYACPDCGERFHMARHRDTHRLRHYPPKFQCKVCDKMFRSAANLYYHMRLHIGDRRFKCKICSKGFIHAASVKEHVMGVHQRIRRVKTRKNKAANSESEL